MPLTKHSKLEEALSLFDEEQSDLSISDMMSILRRALWDNARSAAKKIVKFGKKHPISEEEDYIQTQLMNQFKVMDKMWTAEMKANKLSGKSEDKMNDDFMRAIREMKSTMGSIVRDLKDGTNG